MRRYCAALLCAAALLLAGCSSLSSQQSRSIDTETPQVVTLELGTEPTGTATQPGGADA